tara:strand:+ start:3473 stop:5152 length:1680 start_codon:yes stop_codon:yes gene_type:complete
LKFKNPAYRKLNFLISKKNKRGLYKIFFFLFIGVIFEFFSLGILYPFLTIIQDSQSTSVDIENAYLSSIVNNFSLSTISLILVLSFFLKNILLSIVAFLQNRELYNLQSEVADKIFKKYLNQPYSFFLDRKPSDLIKIIQIEVPLFGAYCYNIINILVESLILISIIVIVIFTNPLISISIFLFFSFFGYIYYMLTKNKLVSIGNKRENVDKEISSLILNSLSGIKEIKIYDKTNIFINKFTSNIFLKAEYYSFSNFLNQLPRYYLEMITLIGLILYILISKSYNLNGNMFATLGFFVAAVLRIIPSLNRVINSIQTLKFNRASVETIYNEVISIENNVEVEEKQINRFKKIKFENVDFSYESKKIIRNLNFTINRGDKVGILGESGSGKSTTVDLITGQLHPEKGQIFIDNFNLVNVKKSFLKQIGYVPQKPFFLNDSVKKNIALGLNEKEIDDNRIKEVLQIVELDNFIFNLKYSINTIIGQHGGKFSGGQAQRLALARALYNNPDLIILDESTSALDTDIENKIIETLFKKLEEKTIIMISHNKSTLKYCDKLLKL